MKNELLLALFWMITLAAAALAAQRAMAFTGWVWRSGARLRLAVCWAAALAAAAALLRWLSVPGSLLAVSAAWAVWFRSSATLKPATGTDWKTRKRWAEVNRQSWLHLALASGAAVFILPFLWLVSTSLKFDDQMKAFPPTFIPTKALIVRVEGEDVKVYELRRGDGTTRVRILEELPGDRVRVLPLDVQDPARAVEAPASALKEVRYFRPRWENYVEALEFLPPEYRRGLVPLWNTVYVTALSIIGLLLSSSLAAYAFSRLRWPGREVFFVVLLATMMLPAAVTMLPVFLIFRWLGWVDTLRPLWAPAFLGSAFHIFLLRQFFLTIPMELEEAAKIDGCNPLTTYWRIMLPLVKPALAAVTIMAFMGSWNNFMGPLIYINSPQKMPLSYALYLFQGMHGGEQGLLMAAATMMMLPVLLVFFFTQRYFIQGITLTGLKG